MSKWIVLAATCGLTIAYLKMAGLLDDPRMIFIGFYGLGCSVFGILWQRDQ